MRTIFQQFLISILFAAAAVGGLTRAESLEELDEVCKKAKNLDDFLSKPELVEEYYTKLEAFYGKGRIQRDEYDYILKKMTKAATKVYGFKERIWETEGTGTAFTIEIPTKSYGRNVDEAKLEELYNNLRKSLPSDWPGDRVLGNREQLAMVLQKVSHDLGLDEDLSGKPDAKRLRAERAERVKQFLATHTELREAVRYQLLRSLNEDNNLKESLKATSPDLFLTLMKDLREFPREHFGALADSPLGAQWLREALPTVNELLDQKEVFPVKTRTTNSGKEVPLGAYGASELVFTPVPRRFHAVWKGLALKECVRTECKRWGSITAKDSQLYYLDRRQKGTGEPGSYEGFVQLVPQVHEATGKIWASLDIGAPILKTEIQLSAQRSSRAPLYELFFGKMAGRLPETWQGMILGEKNSINNARVLEDVHESLGYRLAEPVGQKQEFVPLDAMEYSLPMVEGSERLVHDLSTNSSSDEIRYIDPALFGRELISGKLVEGWKKADPARQEALINRLVNVSRGRLVPDAALVDALLNTHPQVRENHLGNIPYILGRQPPEDPAAQRLALQFFSPPWLASDLAAYIPWKAEILPEVIALMQEKGTAELLHAFDSKKAEWGKDSVRKLLTERLASFPEAMQWPALAVLAANGPLGEPEKRIGRELIRKNLETNGPVKPDPSDPHHLLKFIRRFDAPEKRMVALALLRDTPPKVHSSVRLLSRVGNEAAHHNSASGFRLAVEARQQFAALPDHVKDMVNATVCEKIFWTIGLGSAGGGAVGGLWWLLSH